MKFNRKLQKQLWLVGAILISAVVVASLFSISSSEHFETMKKQNKKTSKSTTKSSPNPKFVLYYANWCPHCKVMMPEWEKLTESYKGPVRIHKIDCALDEHKDVAKKNGVSSFPTIILHQHGMPIHYKGKRTALAMKRWLNKHADV